MWNLNNPKIQNAISESELIDDETENNEEAKLINHKKKFFLSQLRKKCFF